MRGVEQAPDLARGRRRAARRSWRRRARSRSARGGRGRAAARAGRRSPWPRAASRRRAPRTPRGTRGGARCSRSRRCEWVGARVERDQRPAAELERHRLDRQRREVDPHRVARLAAQRRRAGRAGRSRRRPSRSPPASTAWRARPGRLGSSPSSARHSAVSSAAEDDRPAPCSRSLSIVSRTGRSSWPAAGSSATAPRTNARQPVGALRRGERELVLLAEVERARLDPVAGQRLGGHRDAAVDRERQREPGVVVGVLADQVHAARPAGADRLSQGAPA